MTKSSLETRLDFLSRVGRFDERRQVHQFFDGLVQFTPNAERWDYLDDSKPIKILKSVAGLLGWLRTVSSDGEVFYHLRLEMPGGFCQVADRWPLCEYLYQQGLKVTRFDVCLDDFTRRVDFATVKAAGDAGYYRLVDSFKSIESVIMAGFLAVGTCYFGSSDKILRFYDAKFVHDIEADRWELQLRHELARSALNLYLEDPDCLSSLVVGSVDFGISAEQYRDFTRFLWWQSPIDAAGSACKVSAGHYQPDLSRAIKWLDNSVAPTLAVSRDGLGSRFEELPLELCNSGSERLKPYHRQWIESIRESKIDVYQLLTRV